MENKCSLYDLTLISIKWEPFDVGGRLCANFCLAYQCYYVWDCHWHSQLVCFNSVTGNNVCARPRVCVPHSGICSIRLMNLTWALRINAEPVNTSHRPRRENWCNDEQSIFLVAYRENSWALSFDYDLANHTEETSWRWREGEALKAAPPVG